MAKSSFKFTASVNHLDFCTSKQKYCDEIKDTLTKWGEAVSSGDPKEVAFLYDPESVLIATFDSNLILDLDARIRYFSILMHREQLNVRFESSLIRILSEDIATASGIYEFSFLEDGQRNTVIARYSFIYRHNGYEWSITEHHSSLMPN